MDETLAAIRYFNEGNYGLLPRRWLAQLRAIRELPEAGR